MTRSEIKRAHALYFQGKFDEAKAAYLEITGTDSTNAAALEGLGQIALWENQCQEAEHRFKQALHHRPWYRQFWPFHAQLKYRLALTYYRQDSFRAAAECFREAAGPVAIGPFQYLKALADQAALFDDDASYVIEGPEQTKVGFLATDPLPVIEVFVNENGPLNMIIDTGGAELILDRELARRVGAHMCGAIRLDYAGQKTANTGLGRISTVKIGDATVHNIPVHTLDTKEISKLFGGTEIHGIVGTRLLMHFLSTIDYVNDALILRQPALSTGEGAGFTNRHRSAALIPFWLTEMHCMLAWGTLNDLEPMLFFVDTGLAGAGFTASLDVLQRAGIAVDWSKASASLGGAGEVRSSDFVVERLILGTGTNSIVETNVRGVAIEGSASILEGKLGFRVGGLISHQFFRKHSLTLDFRAMRLIVQ
jgi:hypothetical protein